MFQLKSRSTFFAFFTFLFIQSAQSAIWIEPYLGLAFTGKYKLESTSTTIDYDNFPLIMGGRLGAAITMFHFGLDYMKSGDVKLENDTKKYQITELGIFAGVKLPLLVRGYVEYIVASEFSDTGATYDDGSGFKAGVGFTGLPFIAINLEIRQVNYDKYNGASTDMQDKSTALTVSLPFQI
ncbi:MAG: hypothetical protein QE271_03830 [Bacteriovoracaceae bacterium]|nr:hypothetical protein [Bacteriovoracaceae bacterium]